MKKTTAILAALALLSGCQHLAYQPPTGDDTATVLFTSDNIAVQPMICVPGKGFEATEYAVSQKPFQSDFFTELNKSLKKQEQVQTAITAGTPVRLGFSYQSKGSNSNNAGLKNRCKVAVLFTPQAGETYQAHFSLPEGECAMNLTAGGQPVQEAVLAPWTCP